MGRVWVLTGKELNQLRVVLWVGTAVTLVFGLMVPYVYRFVVPMLPSPEMLRGFLGDILRQQLASYRSYLWTNWYGKNLLQNLTVIGIIVGMGAIAGERAKGSLSFLFTLPVSRCAVVAAKAGAASLVLACCTVVPTVAMWAASQSLSGYAVASDFLLGMPLAWAGAVAVTALSMLVSVFTDDLVKAGIGAVGACLLAALPGWFQSTRQFSIFWHMRGMPLLAGAPFPWSSLAPLLAVAAVSLWMTAFAVKRRDF